MSVLRALGRRPFCVALIGVMVVCISVSATRAASVVAQSPQTTIRLGLSPSELEFENPIAPTATTNGFPILEWEDAEFSAAPPYDDWFVVANPGGGTIDGDANEVWMRQVGQIIGATTSVNSTTVSVHLAGDNNDGEAEVWVDGALHATLDMCSPTPDRAWVLVRGLTFGTHSIEVRATGITGCGGPDVATFGAAAVRDVGPFQMSCEGTRSDGGGSYAYQYTLRNVSGSAATLTDLCIGTQDTTSANYTFIPTAGFAPSIQPNDGFSTPCSVVFTSEVKTPHGVLPPQIGGVGSAALVYWTGSFVVPDGGTITFAFDHPHLPWDHEWAADSSIGVTIAQVDQVIAGPTGVYNYGWVHSPGPIKVTPGLSTVGAIVLIGLLILVSAWMLLRSRNRAPETA